MGVHAEDSNIFVYVSSYAFERKRFDIHGEGKLMFEDEAAANLDSEKRLKESE